MIFFYGYIQSLYAKESSKNLSLTFDRFSIENLIDLSKNALTSSVFELEICLLFFCFQIDQNFTRNQLVPSSGG